MTHEAIIEKVKKKYAGADEATIHAVLHILQEAKVDLRWLHPTPYSHGSSLKDYPSTEKIREIGTRHGKRPFLFVNDLFVAIEESHAIWHPRSPCHLWLDSTINAAASHGLCIGVEPFPSFSLTDPNQLEDSHA